MIEHVVPTGTSGELKIVDRTDEEDRTVEFWARSSVPVSIPQFPWSYSVYGMMTTAQIRQFNFQETTDWQLLGKAFIQGNAQSVTLYLYETGSAEMGGPTNLSADLYSYVPPEGAGVVHVKVGDIYKKALVYVNVGGTWKAAVPYVKRPTGWAQTV